MGSGEHFSIKQVTELTGLSEFTIRGWEGRYSAFKPRRTETGRREYRRADIERAILLRELLKRGHRIGSIATLSDHRLRSMFEATEMGESDARSVDKPGDVERVMELLALQKWHQLESVMRTLRKTRRSMSSSDLVFEFLLPALGAMSDRVAQGLTSISQEHVFSSLLKEMIFSELGAIESKRSRSSTGGVGQFVLANPEGDHHELGLLIAHLLIRSVGHSSLFLGPHTPASELAETALRTEATHVLIVSTVSKGMGAKRDFLSYLSDVQSAIGASSKILIAGPQVPESFGSKSSVIAIRNFEAFDHYLKAVGHG